MTGFGLWDDPTLGSRELAGFAAQLSSVSSENAWFNVDGAADPVECDDERLVLVRGRRVGSGAYCSQAGQVVAGLAFAFFALLATTSGNEAVDAFNVEIGME